MSTTPLPSAPTPNLEYYRKQAKALVRSIESAEETALARVRQHLPRYSPDTSFKLSDAQWLLAREHGFVSWAKFKTHVETQAGESNASPMTETSLEKPMNDTKSPAHEPAFKSVEAKTGKSWDEWFTLLDAEGCSNKTHKEIVAVVNAHGAGSWWQQMVTVEYERARGLRTVNQSCDGDHQLNANKTINAPAEAVFAAWADPERREMWLPGAGLTVRKATCPKSLRITWNDGTNVDVNIYPKGDGKCSCSAEHSKLTSAEQVAPLKEYWTAAMARLKEYAEA